jgi:hypothetical protein
MPVRKSMIYASAVHMAIGLYKSFESQLEQGEAMGRDPQDDRRPEPVTAS